MIKSITILLFGILFGGTVTVVAAQYYYKTYFSRPAAIVTPETADYLGTLGSAAGANVQPRTFPEAPITAPSSPSYTVAQSFNLIQTNLREVTESNASVIYKNLMAIKEKAIRTEWNGIFDLVTEVKIEIEQDRSRLVEINGEIDKLQSEDAAKYEDYTEKSRSLATALAEYFDSLDTILVGRIPSKEDTDLVNSKTQSLNEAYAKYDTAASYFLEII